MGQVNLEMFKFGLYVMFPIGWMYYFGTNLDGRFDVPNFWPTPDQAHRLPADREEVDAEARRIIAVQQKVIARREAERERVREEERRRVAAAAVAAGEEGLVGGSGSGSGSGSGKKWWFW